MLEKEFEYYIAHQDEFVKKHNGKVLVIKDENIIGIYDDEITAINETSKTYDVGTFLVHRCAPGKDNYTMTFHSRVTFA